MKGRQRGGGGGGGAGGEGCADLADLLDALQGHVSQHVGLDAAQENVVIHLVYHFLLLQRERGPGPGTLHPPPLSPPSPQTTAALGRPESHVRPDSALRGPRCYFLAGFRDPERDPGKAPTTRLPDRLSEARTLQRSRGRLRPLPARGDHHLGSKGLPWAASLSCRISGSTLPQFSVCSCPGLKTPLRRTLRARGTCYHLPSARCASPALRPHAGASQGDRPLLQRHLSGPHSCYLNFQMILLL